PARCPPARAWPAVTWSPSRWTSTTPCGCYRRRPPRRRRRPPEPPRSHATLDRGHLFVLRDAEGRAAAAGRDHVRVVDLEPGPLERVDVVDGRAVHVGEALVVDEQAQAAVLEDRVAIA